MPRQFYQSLAQFLITFFTGLLIYQHPPADLSQLLEYAWQPMLQGVVAALGIWGASKMSAGGKEPKV